MAGETFISASAPQTVQMQQLENALNGIGVTRSHKTIIFLVVCGVLFDVFEQNAVGLVGPLLREQWGLSATDIGFLNTITFIAAATGRLLSGYCADRFGRRFMLNVNLALFTLDELRFSGAGDPIAALVLCGAHRADRVMIGGEWRVVDGLPVGVDVAALRAAHGQAARRFL